MKTKRLNSIAITVGSPQAINNPREPKDVKNGTKANFKPEFVKAWKNPNSALLKAKKVIFWKNAKARETVNTIKSGANSEPFIKERERVHISEPMIKTSANNALTRTIIVRQELISSPFFGSLGRYLIIPNSRPSLEKPANRVIAEISAAAIPISLGV